MPICAVLTEHGITIAPSTYHAHKATPVSEAAVEEAYLVTARVTLWRETGASPGHGSCGKRPAAPALTSAETRSPG